ncbi:MAG: sigma factor [Rhodanobacteraceae bacterium]
MSRFDTTRWSIVLQARGDAEHARAALETLCRIYRPPVMAYVRSRGYTPDAAEDLVQAFFARFLDQSWHDGADRDRGRFRTYLLTILKRYLINSEVEAHAIKRGGDAHVDSLEIDGGTALACEDNGPEEAFDRAWAVTVLGRALKHLRDEAAHAGKRELFDALREFLIERPDEAEYARTAERLGLRRNTLAVSVHRMRHRLRDLIREELAETTSASVDLDAELLELRRALGAAVAE